MSGGNMSVLAEAGIALASIGTLGMIVIVLVAILQSDKKKYKEIFSWWYVPPLVAISAWCTLYLVSLFSSTPLKWIWQ